jgi:hypothetical protein
VRAKAILSLLKPGHGWGEMSRTTFGEPAIAAVEEAAGLMVASLARVDPLRVEEPPAGAPTPRAPAPPPLPALPPVHADA